MKDPNVTIRLSELTALKNRITYLEHKLLQYEPAIPQVKLVDRHGAPLHARSAHPLKKPGPSSVLESLPDSFSKDSAISKGANSHLLSVWKNRGYISEDKDGNLHKTDVYISRMKQSKLSRLTDEHIIERISYE